MVPERCRSGFSLKLLKLKNVWSKPFPFTPRSLGEAGFRLVKKARTYQLDLVLPTLPFLQHRVFLKGRVQVLGVQR